MKLLEDTIRDMYLQVEDHLHHEISDKMSMGLKRKTTPPFDQEIYWNIYRRMEDLIENTISYERDNK